MLCIFCKLHADRGQSVRELIAAKQAKYRQELGIKLIDEQAYDEVIASSMESVLNDGNVMDLLDQLETADKSLWEKFRSFLEEIADLIRRTVDAFRGVHPESPEGRIVERMTEIHAQLQQAFAEGLHEGGENYRTGGKENTAQNGGVKYVAKYDYTKSFAEQVDDYIAGKIPKGDTLLMGGTPRIYQSLGFNALPMTMNTTHIDYALYGTKDSDHSMGETLLKQLPESLENPVAVFISQTHDTTSVIALLNLTVNGKQTVAPIMIDGYGKTNSVVIDSNAVTSAYGKTSAINQLYRAAQEQAKGNFALLYANKKEALSLLQRAGHQLSGTLIPHDGFYHSIREKTSPVKPKFNDVTETQQFKRWFGDWLKHPKTASKIVNADGTPKIMYHGSPAQFTIFDRKKAKYSGQYGRGFYFTDSQSHAGTYGQQYSVYLNIRNPLQYGKGTVSRDQVRVFLEAVAENEDYAIENYGTYDVDSILQTIMGEKRMVDAFQLIQDINVTAIGDMVEATELFNEVNGTKYDGIVTATETVAFYPEQIKSATDNIGTFDGSNPDIRYSVRYQQNESAAQLLRQENADMHTDVAGLLALADALRKQNKGKLPTAYLAETAAYLKQAAKPSP